MNDSREILEGQLERYEEQLGGLNSYVKELKDRTTEHGTERVHFEEDLIEAEHNIKYYEAEITRIKMELGKSGGTSTLPSRMAMLGVVSFTFTCIGFVAGALLGPRLGFWGGRKNSRKV